jgi:DNA-binding beta-propeller fold protein YncE
VAGATAPLLLSAARADAGAVVPVRRRLVRRGRAVAVSPDGRYVVIAHDLRPEISIATRGRKRRVVDVGGHPVGVAISPDGKLAAVATAFWQKPRVVLVELATGKVQSRHKLGPAPRDVAFTPDGEHLLVIGGEQEGQLHIIDATDMELDHRLAIGRVPRGLATTDGRAWVTLQADGHLVGVDLKRGRVTREIRTAALPDRLAISSGGDRLLLTHGRDTQVSEIELHGVRIHRHAAGRDPSAVAWTRGGHRLVALGGEAAVLDLDRRRRHAVAPAPRDIAVAGRRFWTVSALTGTTSGGRL